MHLAGFRILPGATQSALSEELTEHLLCVRARADCAQNCACLQVDFWTLMPLAGTGPYCEILFESQLLRDKERVILGR